MPMPPRALLLHDIEEYMRTYITIARTADANHARGGGNVQTLYTNMGFGFGGRHTEVRLDAPLVYGYFSTYQAASNTNIFNFSRDRIFVDVGPDDGTGTGLAMYLIPYRPGNARGIKLPSQAQDG